MDVRPHAAHAVRTEIFSAHIIPHLPHSKSSARPPSRAHHARARWPHHAAPPATPPPRWPPGARPLRVRRSPQHGFARQPGQDGNPVRAAYPNDATVEIMLERLAEAKSGSIAMRIPEFRPTRSLRCVRAGMPSPRPPRLIFRTLLHGLRHALLCMRHTAASLLATTAMHPRLQRIHVIDHARPAWIARASLPACRYRWRSERNTAQPSISGSTRSSSAARSPRLLRARRFAADIEDIGAVFDHCNAWRWHQQWMSEGRRREESGVILTIPSRGA